jgi:hypothetical protein
MCLCQVPRQCSTVLAFHLVDPSHHTAPDLPAHTQLRVIPDTSLNDLCYVLECLAVLLHLGSSQ